MIPFLKMHGLGNDFVIIDNRDGLYTLSPDLIRLMSDRNFGIGCDQFIVIDQPVMQDAHIFMHIYNGDGSRAGACGNATRCVASLIMDEMELDAITIETDRGGLGCWRAAEGQITVAMGEPLLTAKDIPIAADQNALSVDLGLDGFDNPIAVGMGNPHAIFIVEDAEAIDLPDIGPIVENHAMFPERTNVEFVSPLPGGDFRMRVWERGAGITNACGSGACAAAVALVLSEKAGRKVTLQLDGGPLHLHWREEDNQILMTGGYTMAFRGEFVEL